MIRSPFKFLDPFGPLDSKVFFGRSAEIDELYAQIFRTPLLLVYGLTGTGKTSLIDCGLRNRFDGTDWLPFYVRRKDDLNEALHELLRKALPDDKPRDLTETVGYLYRYFLRPVYLIFDQFEELFILGSKEEQEAFKLNLKKLLEANLTCKVILIMREEYIGWLYDFERDIPSIFDFRLRVETMKRKNVEEVIQKSCSCFNITLENPEKNIEQIYDNVSEGKAVVQLPYLQVYLDTLYRNDLQRSYPGGAPYSEEQPFPSLVFTGEEIEQCGHISGVLEQFLRDKVSELQVSMTHKYPALPADAVKTILNSFVTEQGTKRPLPYQLIDNQVHFLFPPEILQDFEPGFIHDTVRLLEQNRILRDSGETFELAHDTLAHKIHENRSEEEKRRGEVRARLLTALKEYQDSGTHLNAVQIARLEEWLPVLRVSKAEEDFIAASREEVEAQRRKERQEAEKERLRLEAERAHKRARLFSYITSAVAIVAIAVGVFAWKQQQKAVAAEANAIKEKRRAEAVRDKIYFYRDRFGLAYDKATKKYGFIDKNLHTKIPFKYNEAYRFEDLGYAQVSIHDQNSAEELTYYLIDTFGHEYKLATELVQLDSTITALDLSSKKLNEIPAEVFNYPRLKILFLTKNRLAKLPAEIGKLSQLIYLDLGENHMQRFQPELGALKQLQILDLRDNSIPTSQISWLQQQLPHCKIVVKKDPS